MFVAYAVVGGLLALALIGSAVMTFGRNEQVVDNMRSVNVPDAWLSRLATLKTLGAVGLLVGLAVVPIGVAAAIGVTLYFLGALVFHARAKNWAIAPPLVLLLIAVAALILRLASA